MAQRSTRSTNSSPGSSLRNRQTSTTLSGATISVVSPRYSTVSRTAPEKRPLRAETTGASPSDGAVPEGAGADSEDTGACGVSEAAGTAPSAGRPSAPGTLIASIPFQGAPPPDVHIAGDEDDQEDRHLGEDDDPLGRAQRHRPRVEERRLDVEEDEQHRDH